ncbi:MAG: hypothetical protein U0103_10590 [Candidatus Obscuribacterales bacterium]|nr:hypothetical protein [Cyanobacteria bacterium SZAS LIN-5]
MRNDSETNIAVPIAQDRLQGLEQELLAAETKYGLQSGEAGLALMALVEFLQTRPGNEERIKRLNERIDEIYEIYKAACEE